MKFSCPKCSSKYQIADEKVIGRTLKMKCRKCGTHIPIQGKAMSIAPVLSSSGGGTPSMAATALSLAPTAGSLAPSAPSSAGGRPGASAPWPAGVPRASAPAPQIRQKRPVSSDRLQLSIPAAPAPNYTSGGYGKPAGAPSMPAPAKAQTAPEPQWHAGIGGKVVGPLGERELIEKIQSTQITEETFVWKDGMSDWKPIPEIPELAPLLVHLPAPPSMPAKAKAAAGLGATAGLGGSWPHWSAAGVFSYRGLRLSRR